MDFDRYEHFKIDSKEGSLVPPVEKRKKLTCKKGYEIQVLMSGAGYYIGTMDNTYGPNCRISGYFPTREAAEKASKTRFEKRQCMENDYCSGGNCFE